MLCWRYFYHGLHVMSEVHLPEWEPFEEKNFGGEPDVKISIAKSGLDFGRAPRIEGEHRFFIKDIGWFQVLGGYGIVLQPRARI